MAQVLTQLPALLGVVVGALAAYLTSALNDRTRWRRHQESRWDDRRLEAYAEYGRAIKSMFHLCLRLAASRGLYAGGMPLSYDEADPLLRQADFDRSTKWETVLLVGSPATIEAARAWHELIWRLENIARGDSSEDDLWSDILEESSRARSAYYASARADGGITGSLPSFVPMAATLAKARHEPR